MEDDCKEQHLVKVEVHDVEEGEISDSASVEEISEEAFSAKQAPLPSPQPVPPLRNSNGINVINNNSGGGNGARVWTMRELYQYQTASMNSFSGLYNIAWAQAVNNRPLIDALVMMGDGSNDNSNGNNGSLTSSNGNEDVKEEGELEEGEIEFDTDSVVQNKDLNIEIKNEIKNEMEIKNEVGGCEIKNEVGGYAYWRDELEKSKRVDSIKEELESLNVADAQK